MSVLQRLTEGVINRDVSREGAALLTKWEKTGLLEGLGNDRAKQGMACLLENQAKELLREASSMAAGDVEGFAAVAFPIVRRVFGGLIANDLISVQPMSLPSGLIFFMDFTHEDGRAGFGAGESVYGGRAVASEIIDGVQPEGGFYNLGTGRSSASVEMRAVSVTHAGGAGIGAVSTAATGADVDYDPDVASHVLLTLGGAPSSPTGIALTTGESDAEKATRRQLDPGVPQALTPKWRAVQGANPGTLQLTLKDGSEVVVFQSGGGAIAGMTVGDRDLQAITFKVVRRLTSVALDSSADGLRSITGLKRLVIEPGVTLDLGTDGDNGLANATDTTQASFDGLSDAQVDALRDKIEAAIPNAAAGDAVTHAEWIAAMHGAAGTVALQGPSRDEIRAASNSLGALVGADIWGLEEPSPSTGNVGSSGSKNTIAEIDIKVDSVAVTAQTKKLKAKWSPELGQDLNAYHNLDAEVELTGILSEQIALEIDQEILGELVRGSTAGVRYWSRAPGLFVNSAGAQVGAQAAAPDFTGTVSEWYETLIETINDVSAQIHRKTLRGGANFVVCGPEVANILEFTSGFRASVTADADKGNIGALKAGSLSKKFEVYVDPYFLRNVILVGRKGSSFLESGYVYAPYVPLQVTPTIFGTEDFVPRKGVMTRYAKKMVRPDMYGLVVVRGLLGEEG